jgi:hypothetical protein
MKNNRALAIGLVLVLAVVLGLLLTGGLASAMPADPSEASPVAPAERTPASPVPDAQAWSSGWEIIAPGQTITLVHNLGGTAEDYLVQLWFLDLPAGGLGIHVFGYGGIEAAGANYGAYWQNLTATTIEVVRMADDTTADRVRVWIWTPRLAEQQCSEWSDIDQGDFFTFLHNLGGDAGDYTVSLLFKDTDTGRIHHQGYGGLEVAGERRGAYWRSLDTQFVAAYRYTHDPYADQVRLCVSVPEDPPVYDSGWWPIAPGTTLTLTHDVGGNVNNYVVDVEFKDPDGQLAVHQAGLGGDFLDPPRAVAATAEHGAHWQRLTNSTIEVVRQQYDPYVGQVRVRIWQRKVQVFLPLVLRGY